MVERGSEEPTRNLRAGPGRVPGSDEPTRDLRRDVLRRLGPPPVRGPVPGPPRPLPAPGAPPARAGASAGRVVLIVVGVLVGLVFLGVAGVGLYAVLGGGSSSSGSGGDGAATTGMSAGDCVAVRADGKGSVVAPAPCGSAAANFRVVDVVAAGTGCPGDVNLSYPLTGDAAAQTACLDVDWVVGDCFELSGTYPQRVDCTAPPGRQSVRVVDVDRTGAETAKCPSGSGLPYPQRRFVVCLDPV
jgi:hypothetical protein